MSLALARAAHAGLGNSPALGCCEGWVVKALGTWLARNSTEALACLFRQPNVWAGVCDVVQHAGGLGTYLVVDTAALLRSGGNAASHGEMRRLHQGRWCFAVMAKRCRRLDGRCPFGEGSTPSACVLAALMQGRQTQAW